MQWLRIWHGFLQSPKWTLVAQRAECSRGDVLNVALFLLDYASRNDDRGSIEGFDADECDVVTGVTRNVVTRIVTEITRLRRSPLVENRWRNWEEYQPRDTTAAERMRRHREKKKQELSEAAEKRDEAESVTQRSVTRNVTPEQNITEQNKKETRAQNAALDSVFEERFWPVYPRPEGKAAAKKKFTTKAKTVGVDPILTGLTRATAEWQRKGTDPEFIPHATTWLNQERWADEPSRAPPKREEVWPGDYG